MDTGVLNCIKEYGVCIVRKDNSKVVYRNDKLIELEKQYWTGWKIDEIFASGEMKPLTDELKTKESLSVVHYDRFSKCDVNVSMNNMLWEDGVDAILVTVALSDNSVNEQEKVNLIKQSEKLEKEYNRVQQENLMLEYMRNVQPGGYNRCKDEPGYPIVEISPRFEEVLGYGRKEIEQQFDNKYINLVHPDDVEGLKASINNMFNVDNNILEVKYRMRTKDKGFIWVNEVLQRCEFEGEAFYHGIILDITKEHENIETIGNQKVVLEKQEKNAELLGLINALSRDYTNVFFMNLEDETVVSIYSKKSKRAEEIIKLLGDNKDFQELRAVYINTMVCDADKEKLLEVSDIKYIKNRLKKEDFYVCNYRAVMNGQNVYIQFKCVRIDGKESASQVIMGFRNVDKEVREEMERNQILSDALARAEFASQAKTIFLNNMSHDIRTPMNAIVGYTSLAIKHMDSSTRLTNYLQKINQSSNHLMRIINDVLDMSRIESGKTCIEDKPENLSALIHDLKNLIQADMDEKKLEFSIDTVDIINENIICDKLRLNQVLLNLLSNAVKYTPEGGSISMRIKQIETHSEDKATYEFYIKDTGVGISPDFIEHIFEPFSREKNSTISGIQGTGLGLSITKNIVDLKGGTISVNSKLGKGTEFIVALPFKLQENSDEPKVIRELEGIRALVVDVDEVSCKSVSKMLSKLGLRTEWVVYGKEAAVRAAQAYKEGDQYQVYLINWIMPDIDGTDTVKGIREIVGEDIPIIMMTAGDWENIDENARKAGVTDFVCKPLFVSDLRNVLVKMCYINNEVKEQAKDDIDFKGKKILLVEDNELNQEIAYEILTAMGLTVEIADNGKNAVDILKSTPPDFFNLVFMDIQMPIMDGYEATKVIRKFENEKLASIPIVALTANAFEADRRLALEAGMNEHITKPFDVGKLKEVLSEYL